jgi:hypothetical protein
LSWLQLTLINNSPEEEKEKEEKWISQIVSSKKWKT